MANNQELAVVLKLVADQFQRELSKSKGLVGDFTSAITGWKGVIGAVGATFAAITKSTANYGDELTKNAQKIGISIGEYQGLKYAADLSNVSTELLANSLGFLDRKLFDASQNNQEAQKTFEDLHISIKDGNGALKSASAVALEISDRFRTMPDGPMKTALAIQALGKAGKESIPLLNSDMREASQEAKALGLTMDEKAAAAAERFNDNITRLKAAMRGLTIEIGDQTIPVLNTLAETMVKVAKEVNNPPDTMGWKMLDQLVKNLTGLPPLPPFVVDALGGYPITVDPNKYAKPIGPKQPDVIPKPDNSEQLRKLYEVRRKLAEDEATLYFNLTKNGLEQQKMLAEQDLALKEMTQQQYLERVVDLDDRQFTYEKAKLDAMQKAENEFYRKSIATKFKSDEEKQVFEAKHTERLRQFQDQQTLLMAEANKRQVQFNKDSLELEFHDQEALGRRIMESSKSYFEITRQQRQTELQDSVNAREAEIEALQNNYGSFEDIAKAQEDLLTAQLAKELNLSRATVDAILEYRRTGDYENAEQSLALSDRNEADRYAIITSWESRINQAHRRATGGFLEGYKEGMVKYVNDTQSFFSLAVDSARQTAQAMQQGFQQFFFDAMSGKITSLKDALNSFLNFAKQISSQIASTLITGSVLRGLASTFPSLFPTSGSPTVKGFGGVPGGTPDTLFYGGWVGAQRFAVGGPVYTNGDRFPALLRRGEFVLTPEGVDTLTRVNQGQLPYGFGGRPQQPLNVVNQVDVQVVNQVEGATVQTRQQTGPDGRKTIQVLIAKEMQNAMGTGALDRAFALNYGITRKGVSR